MTEIKVGETYVSKSIAPISVYCRVLARFTNGSYALEWFRLDGSHSSNNIWSRHEAVTGLTPYDPTPEVRTFINVYSDKVLGNPWSSLSTALNNTGVNYLGTLEVVRKGDKVVDTIWHKGQG